LDYASSALVGGVIRPAPRSIVGPVGPSFQFLSTKSGKAANLKIAVAARQKLDVNESRRFVMAAAGPIIIFNRKQIRPPQREKC
jgi:hypothetical protein